MAARFSTGSRRCTDSSFGRVHKEGNPFDTASSLNQPVSLYPHCSLCRPRLRIRSCSIASTRKSVACFGAVSLRTGSFVRAMCATFNAGTFENILKTLLQHRARSARMVVVLDNAQYHHAILINCRS